MAQNGVVVKGKVLDANDEPLIGAAIVLKGNTNVGTVADFDGNFTLEVPDRNSVLTVSYLGMTPQDVKVNGRTMIVVVLREDTEVLDEVVVVGYGQQKKHLSLDLLHRLLQKYWNVPVEFLIWDLR